MAAEAIIACTDLVKSYRAIGIQAGKREFTAVDRLSLAVSRGETLALVGESGCGKSTTGRLLLALEQPSAGEVAFDGVDLSTTGPAEVRKLRRRMQMVFQDPYGSLNPRFSVRRTLAEPLRIHLGLKGKKLNARVEELLEAVGLEASHAGRYPHEFSGGQRQRIAIARAISVEPEFIVADEPVSALDISIQGQILRLLIDLRRRLGMAMLFISHDLAVVRQISDRVAVMYRGRIVELAPSEKLFAEPLHPYTRLLLESVLEPRPVSGVSDKRVEAASADLNTVRTAGCSFAARCPESRPDCFSSEQTLTEITPDHFVACHVREGAKEY